MLAARAPRAGLAVTLALAVFSAGALAGCFGSKEEPTTFKATLANAWLSHGWDYAGENLQSVTGTITVDVDAAADTGLVTGNLTLDGVPYGITFDAFAEGSPVHEGGIRKDFQEHGDTGNGDTLIPELHALVAAWGTASVTKGGVAFPDPFTGNARWSAHLMVTDTAVRAPGGGAITKADGSTPYDPETPGDGLNHPDTPQAILILKSPAGNAAASPVDETFTGTVVTNEYAQDHAFTTVKDAKITVNVTVTGPDPVPLVAELKFDLVDPEGNVVQTATLGGPNRETTAAFEATAVDSGDYLVRVTGNGAEASYEAVVSAVPPGPQFMAFWFDGVTIE